MNPLNTRFNKAGDATEQGLLMTIITFLVVFLVPNAKAPAA
jgi:hypothetical protein